jgi:uroporphyrinogen decarboxylase
MYLHQVSQTSDRLCLEFLTVEVDLREPVQYSDWFNIVENLDERVMQRLHSDMRSVGANIPRATIESDGTKTWPFMCGARIHKVGYYDEPFDWPMRHMTTKKDIDEYPWPPLDINIMDGVVERARYLHEETDHFVQGELFSNFLPFDAYGLVFTGIDRWLTDMKSRPRFYHQLSEKLLEIGMAYADQFFGGIGHYLDGATIFDNLGTQVGGLMSLADYREFYRPYQAEIIKNIRKYLRPEAKIIIHSCGSNYAYIPDLIDIGVDILNPVQPLARKMEPWRLKSEFGDKIAFLGGFDIQQLLPLGNKEQVREGVKKLIQEYAHGGGFIFATGHNIEPDTPPGNIVAMFDAAYEYGRYPIPRQTGLSYVDYIMSLNLH